MPIIYETDWDPTMLRARIDREGKEPVFVAISKCDPTERPLHLLCRCHEMRTRALELLDRARAIEKALPLPEGYSVEPYPEGHEMHGLWAVRLQRTDDAPVLTRKPSEESAKRYARAAAGWPRCWA